MTVPSVSSSGLAAPGVPPPVVLQLLVVNGGWLLSACQGEDVDGFAGLASTACRGPRGGIGLSRGTVCASASPKQATAANAQTLIQVTDLMASPFFAIDYSNSATGRIDSVACHARSQIAIDTRVGSSVLPAMITHPHCRGKRLKCFCRVAPLRVDGSVLVGCGVAMGRCHRHGVRRRSCAPPRYPGRRSSG